MLTALKLRPLAMPTQYTTFNLPSATNKLPHIASPHANRESTVIMPTSQ